MATAKRTIPPALSRLPAGAPTMRDALVQMLGDAIAADVLPAELALPSCRVLAAAHGVSKNTVQAAYDRLVELGLVQVRPKSGYFVAMVQGPPPGFPVTATARSALTLPEPRPSSLPRVRHPPGWRESRFPFVYNQIDPTLFPIEAWRECSRLALGKRGLAELTADDEAGDNPHLVSHLRKRLLAHRGIAASEGEIMVTLGTQNVIALAGLLVRPIAGMIAVEDPGYPDARNAFALTGNAVAPVPVDGEGLRVDLIPPRCKLVYVTPSHQFPTGVTLSFARRHALLAAAEQHDFLILEDDYEADLEPSLSLPTLRSLDRHGRVIYASSLSKTLSPSLRLGFMVAPPDLIEEAKALRHALLRHAPTAVQETAALFIGLGHYDTHLRRLNRDMALRRLAMHKSLALHLGQTGVTAELGGGTSVWLTGPRGLDCDLLARDLAAVGVIVDPGRIFYADQDVRDSFRMGFAAIAPKLIEDGCRLVARLLTAGR